MNGGDLMEFLPGTVQEISQNNKNNPTKQISSVLEVTGGLTLAQLRNLTGLEGSTVQNWIRRGWVANPKDKLYKERQLMRIILINCLRGALPLDMIPRLMSYINGEVEDESDDIITDMELYSIFCRIVFACDDKKCFDEDFISSLVKRETENYTEPVKGAKERLEKALNIMTLAYLSSRIKDSANKLLGEL